MVVFNLVILLNTGFDSLVGALFKAGLFDLFGEIIDPNWLGLVIGSKVMLFLF